MIKNVKADELTLWLSNTVNQSSDKTYRHRLLKEDKNNRRVAVKELKGIFKGAHNDARLRLRKVLDISLDPLEEEDSFDPAYGYPESFDMTTLKGYFGEVFAGLIAENFNPFDEKDWRVPAFSFRYHEIAFDQLEMQRLTGEMISAIPGRTGDDCLAFVLDDHNRIVKVLFCEAKCTADHSSNMIADAHSKISSKNIIPVEIRRIIDILNDYDDEEALTWKTSLRELYLNKHTCERLDLVSYVCGRPPSVSRNKKTWMSVSEPHKKYIGNRKLESVEIHVDEVESLIKEVYKKVTT